MAKKVIKNHQESQERLSSKVKNPEKSPPQSKNLKFTNYEIAYINFYILQTNFAHGDT